MAEYLLFHLYAPMASWGDMAVGEVRHTHPIPTKSSLLGLVAGALGIGRDEEDRLMSLHETLGLAVMVLSYGDRLRDYHTVQVAPEKKRPYFTRKEELDHPSLSTLLSSREYVTDALYRVALWKREAGNSEKKTGITLEQIAEALNQPVYTPYLGRKSCPPGLPFHPQIETADSLAQALRKPPAADMTDFRSFVGNSSEFDVYHDPLANDGLEKQVTQQRKDNLHHSLRRQFTDRTEQKSILRGANHVLQPN